MKNFPLKWEPFSPILRTCFSCFTNQYCIEKPLSHSLAEPIRTVHLNSRFVFALNREAAFGGRASLFVACRMTSFPKTQQTFCNINAGGTLCVETTTKNTTTARSIFRRKERGRRRTRRLGAAAARKSRSTKSDDAYAREEDSLKRSTQNTTTTTLTTQKKKTKTTKTKKSEEKATRRDFAMKTTILLSSSTFLDAGDARADDNNAFVVFAERIRANNAASSSSSSSSDTSLEDKIAHPKLFKKRVINKSKPGATKYPLFLLGEWEEEVSFAGYEFPSDEFIDRKTLERAATCPGFQKLSVAYLPDVGKTPAPKYRARFVHEKPGENVNEASGDVVEDRAFNLRNIFNAYLEDETAVESVDYDFSKNPNRATVTLRRGAANNAERVELFTNARESETSGIDGCSFLCAETLRQVSLGYSVDYNTARVVNYDYEHVWRYQPMRDDKITPFDVKNKGDSFEDIRRCNFVKARLFTVAYLQSDDAMRATARVNQAGTAPIPSLFDAGTAAYAPAVVYSHDVLMERVGCVP